MKAKIKNGGEFLFTHEFSNKWDDITNFIVINFNNRYTYKSFKQVKNHLFIDTTEGEIDIVFVSEVPKLEFDYFEKDQLVLKVIS